MRGRLVLALGLVVLIAVTASLVGVWVVDRLTAVDEPDPVELGSGAGSSSDVEVEADATAEDGPPPEVPEDAEPAIVDRVVDGDTVRVIASPGGTITEGGSVRIRLLNIDAPEHGREGQAEECGAAEATARVEALLAPGDLVWLAGDVEDRDVYDRPLRGLWTEDGRFVNLLLAEEGYVESLLIAPNDRFHEEIAAAARSAEQEGRGLWGEHCPG